jgi:hypothetical protein
MPVSKIYSDLKCKERYVSMMKFFKRKWEEPAESPPLNSESVDPELHYNYTLFALFCILHCSVVWFSLFNCLQAIHTGENNYTTGYRSNPIKHQ